MNKSRVATSLILLVAEATAKSTWVAREVDYAKGARVPVLPVLIRSGYDIKSVMERFNLNTVQYVSLLNGNKDELKLYGPSKTSSPIEQRPKLHGSRN